ncbi:MAG TPA: sigma-70 family RNA polymerase sigma factor, partial [Ktedonobacteraceae bacterium]|nr:sigma-70 family RNA polymerase sigma factor [Ktedonobacteraceae bacterium]
MMHQPRHQAFPEESPVAALYQRHARMVLAYIRQRVSSKEDAEDLLVEVFLVAIQNETPLHLNEKEQLTWLRRVAHNKLVDRYRRLNRLPALAPLDEFAEVLLDDDEHTPEAMMLRQADHMQLQTHLAGLSPMQQEILRLRFVGGLSTREIATRLAKNHSTIRMALSRTLNYLRRRYEQ